jgi:hypothetical protein
LGTPTATPATASVRSQRMAKLNIGSALTMEEGMAVSNPGRVEQGCCGPMDMIQTQRQMPCCLALV